jgi:putative glutamine amidotransferase
MSGAPVIGITAYREQARFGVWDLPTVLLPADYPSKVEAAGAIAVVLPPGAPAEVLDRLDGLVLSGGADIDPGRYGAPTDAATSGVRPDRDASEVALAAAALDRDVPVLAICRGMQLLAVATGGSLHQHVPDVVGHEHHRPQPGTYGSHRVRIEPGTRLHALLGDSVDVNSHHHQGIDATGEMRASGWAEDGLNEALEHPDRAFDIGVQWHPEALDDLRLFEALVAQARSTSAPRERSLPAKSS